MARPRPVLGSPVRRAAAGAALLALAACRTPVPPEPARTADRALVEVAGDELPVFEDDLDYAGLDDALSRSALALARLAVADPGRTFAFGKERIPVQKLQATLARFREIALARPTPAELQATLRREFRVFRSVGDGTGAVLVTGYYLPELRGALARGGAYQVPLHRAPDDLVVVRAKDFPPLADDLVGRVEGGRLLPYPTRAEIAGGAVDDRAALCFVDSAVDAFFLEIQGSGVVRFEDGTSHVVTFAGKNGHRYEAIGAELVRRGAIPKEQVSMQAIRAWLAANPGEQAALLARNPSYVFFRFADAPTGSLGVPVTPDRTIAADARVFPKGALAFLASERPIDASGVAPSPAPLRGAEEVRGQAMRPFSRFVLDQDAGGAIRTSARVDLYLGSGAYAENAAGRMRQPGRLHYLLLR